ncbi:MAG TPA: hypothetical protein PK916_04485 [Bacteroidota bacterium]|nr:hypothetical protein [Bacteroidota bacterium]
MLTLYLACLISGGILLTISLFSGGDADSDMDHGLDAHADLDHSLDAHADMDHTLDAHADVDHALDAHVDAGHGDALTHTADVHHGDVAHASGGMMSAAFQFFSFRNIVYLTTFFGLTGSILTWMATPAALTLLSAIGMGGFAMFVGHKFMRYLKSSESGEAVHERSLIGHVGTVSLAPTKERKGKVRVSMNGQWMEMLALVHPDSARDEYRFGEHVLILDVEHNVAQVDEAPFADE